MNFPDTPSLAILKSDAKILLRAARDQSMGAIVRLVHYGYWRSEEITLDNCLCVVAKEYARTFATVTLKETLISRYVQYA